MCVTVVTADNAAASVRSHRTFIVWDHIMGLSGSEIKKHSVSTSYIQVLLKIQVLLNCYIQVLYIIYRYYLYVILYKFS